MAFDRRVFLGSAAGSLATLSVGAYAHGKDPAPVVVPKGGFDTLFLTWQRDPTTTMTIQWVDADLATLPAVSYALAGKDQWTPAPALRKTNYPMTDLRVYRTELTGLTPGTEYQFKIEGLPEPRRFRTMPAKATNAFHFVSGGDCGVNDHVVKNNIIAAKQDPMFTLIGGDLAYDNGRDANTALAFARNYSVHMIDTKGRMVPLVTCIGNHEVNGGYNKPREAAPSYFALHDGLFPEKSYATLDFGDYLSLVLLDTGHVAQIGGEQTDWLDKALADRVGNPNLICVNHAPAYPSYRPSDGILGSGFENRKFWVPLFEKHNIDVVLEHHDHTFKRTHPMKDGHVDKNGIVYLGDGSWGKIRAPLAPEKRPYLVTATENYHLTLHRLEGEQRFHMAIDENGKVIDVCMTTKKPRGKSVG